MSTIRQRRLRRLLRDWHLDLVLSLAGVVLIYVFVIAVR
jgi:hypothetical protein